MKFYFGAVPSGLPRGARTEGVSIAFIIEGGIRLYTDPCNAPPGASSHFSESGAATSRLPLAHHCADVAAVAEALLRKGAISRRLARLAGLSCLPPELVRALVRTAFLHDLGKCNRGFQAKAIPKADRGRLGIYTAGHVREIAPLLNPSLQLHREPAIAYAHGRWRWTLALPDGRALSRALDGAPFTACSSR